ncbi:MULTISPECIES: hypothetical protein [unclassified Streptomyces]|uniref:hypothetical protein n=1 Tax=unclassified Streptomyces TaxID=2593676 RepID=UPI0037FFBAFD
MTRTAAEPAGETGRGRGALWRVPLVVTVAVLPLYAVWAALLATGGGDLAAQFAWAGFAARHPGSAYNLSWYGGTHTANYSVLAPPLMAVVGVRTVTVLAGLAGTWAMAALFVRARVDRAAAPALLGAVALWCNVASGRTTFALGVAVALWTLWWVGRPVVVVLGAALTALVSPVAGLFLVVAGAAYALDRRWRLGAALVVPPMVAVGAVTLLFPFEGEQPMAPGKLSMPLVACAALCVAAPRAWRVVRYGAGVYALGVVLTFLVASPIGTNVERLAGLAGPPVLLAALLTRIGERAAGWRRPAAGVLAGVLAVNMYWLVDKTEDDLVVSTTVPAWASHTGGVLAALDRLGAERTRVEVVPARNHREADVLAPYISMARGWNRQLDVERGRLFYADPGGTETLSPDAYRAWLDRWAVGLVVLPHGRPDGPAEAEAALVRSGPDALERVWADDWWTVYRVRDAVPLVPSPATVVRSDGAELVVRIPEAGSVTVRVAYSPWLRAPGACVERAGDWTRLTVTAPGEYRLGSAYRLALDSACPAKKR